MSHFSRSATLAAFLLLPLPAASQTLLTGDYSIDGKLCAGQSCSGTESFSFDISMKLKGVNTGILFDDASTSPNVPNADWEIKINDNFPGGQNYFAIQSPLSEVQHFRIDQSAPLNGFYMDDEGDIGLGTSLPEADLHIESGSAADIRLNLNTSTGFSPVSFDLGVSSSGFEIFDNISNRRALVIEPNVPRDAIRVRRTRLIVNNDQADFDVNMDGVTLANVFALDASADQIGMGTGNPIAPLHVRRTTGGATADFLAGILVENVSITAAPRGLLTLRNRGQVFFGLEDISIPEGDNTGRQWNFQNNGGEFRVTTAPGGGSDIEMRLDVDGNMRIEGNYFANSFTQMMVPDYVFEPDYALRPLSEVEAFVTEHKHLPEVPSAAEMVAEGVNLNEMQMTLLKKIEELTLYTLDLQAQVSALEARLSD